MTVFNMGKEKSNLLKKRPVRLKEYSRNLTPRKCFLAFVEKLEKSKEAKDMRERLLKIAKKLETASGASQIAAVLDDLAKARRILVRHPGLRALYGLQAKTLMEEAEYKRTGVRIILD